MIPPLQALQALKDGNRRFIGDAAHAHTPGETNYFGDRGGKSPFAIILGCSDARVPVEIIFDQGLGDLFVIRVAGNIIAPSQVGSIEFAAKTFGTQLVVVLGHTDCGAIRATVDELRRPLEERSPNLAAIVDRIRPSVADLLNADPPLDSPVLLEEAVRANIRATVSRLHLSSPIIEKLVSDGALQVVGAEYSVATGTVEFFET
jgi:carbonic anhydrase